MELVVNWTSMATILFSKSNMIDVIIAVAPFTTHFYIVMLYVNMANALTTMICMWLKDLLFNHGWIYYMFVAFVSIFI